MWKKDYATMLEAMARQPEGVLLVAGEGPLKAELQSQSESLGTRVRFLGLREDVPDLMNACDGFVMSSIVEGLPMVLIEAALAGLPTVATDAGGVREVIREGQTGWVVPPGDATALAEAMQRLTSLPVAVRHQMGESARRDAEERFHLSEVASRWERLYLDCLSRAQRQLQP
jgi:glycosyltransferase involved in cell wall biosynthesis